VKQHLERAGRRGHHTIAAAVVAGGGPVFAGWSVGDPPPDEQTLFEIGSITKAFTGILLADMHLRGEVDLDDPLSRHLRGSGPAWRRREPTLRELATHRSGLPNVPGALGRKELAFGLGIGGRDPWRDVDAHRYLQLQRETSPRLAPGGRLRYSSMGYGLLGDALAAAAGKQWEDLLRERILAPLGMHATAVTPAAAVIQGRSRRGKPRPPIEDLMPAAGSLRSNLADMSAFLEACRSPGPDPPGEALGLAQRPAHRINRRMSIGLGWLIVTPRAKNPVVWHNGGTWGFRSFAGFSQDRGRAALVLANTARSVDRLGWRLLDEAEDGCI
jgi:CubicO group peptidase (beta-lactamase class C family)